MALRKVTTGDAAAARCAPPTILIIAGVSRRPVDGGSEKILQNVTKLGHHTEHSGA